MSNPLPPGDLLDGISQIHQNMIGDRNQAIGQVLGGIVVYVSGGQAVFHSASTESASSAFKPTPSDIGSNPYKGLMAFQETDGDRFFGREKQISALWEKLRSLHETESAIRVLPIYGPSGSGKSSLARAGLIPELARHPIPGYDRARVAVLVPGTHPLESLATVLARIVTHDLTPVAKTREFAGELKQANEAGEYDGLRRIADVMPDIAIAPLVVLVDQFEEVYTLCKDKCEDKLERDAFIGNLLHAASDRAKRVTVIVTLRSDLLGETQKHAVLNRLFSEQGYLVPAMTLEELRQAIAKPAELAGHPLDTAIIDLLVKDTEGREGALPLLQFALTRIWEGSVEGKPPAETLKTLGGVGGALAGEAERIYSSLNASQQAIARRVFLGLVQLGEGIKDTRRRVAIDSLIAHQDQQEQVEHVINSFAKRNVRLITLAASGNTRTAEVTHETLFEHWEQLQEWLNSGRDDVRFHRRLEDASQHWDKQQRPGGLLWRSPDLDLLKEFVQRSGNKITHLQLEFFQASQKEEQNQIREKRKREQQERIAGLLVVLFLGVISLGLVFFSDKMRHQQQLTEAVFLGANAKDIVAALPELEKTANELRQSIDTMPESVDPEVAIAHYNQQREEFRKLFAYYRNILTVVGRLGSEAPQTQKQQAKRVEQILASLLGKYRIPQLRSDLDNKRFGRFLDKPVTEYENQYSEGALRTTYKILMTNDGAGADLNKDGFIADTQEANQMPCETLERIEKLWREATNHACGWYSPEGHFASDSDCVQAIGNLDPDRSSLYTLIFGHDENHAIERIKQCGIQPQ